MRTVLTAESLQIKSGLQVALVLRHWLLHFLVRNLD